MKHKDLCLLSAKYLRNKGIQPYHRCQYAVSDLDRIGEKPDAFGWGGSTTQLIEVKTSRSDFLSDKKKIWRQIPHLGLGAFRSYLCPIGLIEISDLPDKWGLLYVSDDNKITVIKQPEMQESNHIDEINLITSILRREGIKPNIFSYKKYKN